MDTYRPSSERQRRELVSLWRRRETQLREAGVPGMKWGVRKGKAELGKIEKSVGRSVGQRFNRLSRIADRTAVGLDRAKTGLGKSRLQRLMRDIAVRKWMLIGGAGAKVTGLGKGLSRRFISKDVRRVGGAGGAGERS